MVKTEKGMKLIKKKLIKNKLFVGGQLASSLAMIACLTLAPQSLLGATPPQLSDVRIELDPTNRTVNVTYALDRDALPPARSLPLRAARGAGIDEEDMMREM